ncbi:M-phase phosphoprotein 6 [Agrilus planipennis]|uniref:M-phase phosphoprotein 6 n=1 Tax=Agrilus planipennis TaxID=224129 RepID=A0A1W4XVQ8_AGRPL|nr:M-phase phosphoprotein 6 [Agrilus planipennis]
MDEKKNAKLSRAVLDMKFMKKTKERVLKEEENAEGQLMYSNEITEEMKAAGNTLFVETTLVYCKDLVEGRLSFGGMNPVIEKIMKEEYTKKLEDSDKAKEKDVSDIEMAKGYSTVVDTIGKKFHDKRNRYKKKFIKPSDD